MLPSILLLFIYAPLTLEQPKNLTQLEVKLLEEKDSWMLIGRGSFGSVFRFQDELTGVKYAVKILQIKPEIWDYDKLIISVSSEPIIYKGKKYCTI